jgi:hypothetical protein
MFVLLLAAAPLTAVRADNAATPKAESSQGTAKKSLDLKAPAINRVFTRDEIAAYMAKPDEVDQDVVTTVDVEGDMHERVNVPSGIMSLPWAIRHPTQAWRIFAPSPSQ